MILLAIAPDLAVKAIPTRVFEAFGLRFSGIGAVRTILAQKKYLTAES
jgi:hypothetical protein